MTTQIKLSPIVIEVAKLINSKGVHYEFCGRFNESDDEFVSNLGHLDPVYIDESMIDDLLRMSPDSTTFDIAAFIVEAAYVNQTDYEFKMEGSIIALNK